MDSAVLLSSWEGQMTPPGWLSDWLACLRAACCLPCVHVLVRTLRWVWGWSLTRSNLPSHCVFCSYVSVSIDFNVRIGSVSTCEHALSWNEHAVIIWMWVMLYYCGDERVLIKTQCSVYAFRTLKHGKQCHDKILFIVSWYYKTSWLLKESNLSSKH